MDQTIINIALRILADLTDRYIVYITTKADMSPSRILEEFHFLPEFAIRGLLDHNVCIVMTDEADTRRTMRELISLEYDSRQSARQWTSVIAAPSAKGLPAREAIRF